MTRTFDSDYYADLLTHLKENTETRAESMGYERALRRSCEKFCPELSPAVAKRILAISWTEPATEHLQAADPDDEIDLLRARAFSVLVQDVHSWTVDEQAS